MEQVDVAVTRFARTRLFHPEPAFLGVRFYGDEVLLRVLSLGWMNWLHTEAAPVGAGLGPYGETLIIPRQNKSVFKP